MSVYAKFPWRDKYSPSLLVCVLSCIGNFQLDLDIGKVLLNFKYHVQICFSYAKCFIVLHIISLVLVNLLIFIFV